MNSRPNLFDNDQVNECSYIYKKIQLGECTHIQKQCEDLWRDYWKYADDNFLQEFALNFHQRWFEMYLTVALLRSGVSIECKKPGPDILTVVNKRRVWIEAVCATRGTPGLPDSVPEISIGVAQKAPVQQILMRICNSLSEKSLKFQNYIEKGIVDSKKDLTVIALSIGEFPEPVYFDELMKRAIYGIGDPYVAIERNSRKVTGTGCQSVEYINKFSSGAPVSVRCFIDRSMAHISALLASWVNCGILSSGLGDDFVVYPNLTCDVKWTSNIFPVGEEWIFDETNEKWNGQKIVRVKN